MFGEDAWTFMDGLHQNISAYTHSGSKPCKMAGAGETVVGVSFDWAPRPRARALRSTSSSLRKDRVGKRRPPPLSPAPRTSKPQRSSTFRFREANEMYNEGYAVLAYPGIAKPVENLPANVADHMIKNDFEWAANNRKAILAEWAKRYDAKSEPKT
jgi:iron(III) transport system substrate-binding protein